MEHSDALELVARLSRTKNYPKDEVEVGYLAEGLILAVKETGANPDQIVMICRTTSEWCPTDHDLMTIGRQIRDEQKRAREALEPSVETQWKAKYGEPKQFDWKALDMDRLWMVKEGERIMLERIKAKYPGELTWAGMIAAARDLGFEYYAKTWEERMR